MYVIAVYDIGEKRVGKMLKLCRRYLTWIQNSVFDFYFTESRLKALKIEAGKIMEDDDSFIIFKTRQEKWLDKDIMGKERSGTDNFL